jgi:hypothetical protein
MKAWRYKRQWIISLSVILIFTLAATIGSTSSSFVDPETSTGNINRVITNWYDLAWGYRKPITINNSGSALTNYQVKVTVNTQTLIGQGKMQSDGDDIRFTQSNGSTEIPYWLESGINTASTIIWAKVPSIPAGNSTLYMYYGNSTASGASSVANTFAGGSFTDTFTDTSKINTTDSVNVEVSGGEVRLTQVSSAWLQTSQADFEAGLLSQVDTSSSPGDVKLSLILNPTLVTSDNSVKSVRGTTPTLVKTLSFTKSGTTYNELRINSNLRIDSTSGSKTAYSDIRVDDVSKFTHNTQSTTYISYQDTLDFSGYADGAHTVELYLYTDNSARTAYNSIFELYRTKTYASPGTIASQVLDTGATGATWNQLSWSETLQTNTDITFEVRASDTSFAKDAGTPSWISVGGTSPVTSGLPSGRYMQWRATLSTSDTSKTPTLHDVTVTYNATHYNASGILRSVTIPQNTSTRLAVATQLSWTDNELVNTDVKYQLEYYNGAWALIPDIDLAGNSIGFDDSPIDISSVKTTYGQIRLRANLSTTDNTVTPTIQDWTVTYYYRQYSSPEPTVMGIGGEE